MGLVHSHEGQARARGRGFQSGKKGWKSLWEREEGSRGVDGFDKKGLRRIEGQLIIKKKKEAVKIRYGLCN